MVTDQRSILIVDDEPDIREILSDILGDEGYQVHTAENAAAARDAFTSTNPDLVLLDIWMPDEDGISVLKKWVEDGAIQNTPVIMISGHGTVDNAVEAVKLGAYDFLEKPLSTDKLLLCIARGLEQVRLKEENRFLKSKLQPSAQWVAESDASRELMRHVKLLGPTDSWIFITGESGSGKRLVAEKIHAASPRAAAPFVELNLAVLPPDQVAQQLFGREEADTIVYGSFESAAGGTLFINEVLGLNLDTQHKLLSALQEQQFIRLGGHHYIDLDVRVVVTTSGNPQEAVSKGQFLEDLYYRLNVIPIQVPPLRERRSDLPDLIRLFVEKIARRNNLKVPRLSKTAVERLIRYDWPGNVRQLQNVLNRLILLNNNKELTADDVTEALGGDLEIKQSGSALKEFFTGDMREAKDRFERAYLHHHLEQTNGNVSKLSKKIGLERTHLYRKLKQLNVSTNTGAKAASDETS